MGATNACCSATVTRQCEVMESPTNQYADLFSKIASLLPLREMIGQRLGEKKTTGKGKAWIDTSGKVVK